MCHWVSLQSNGSMFGFIHKSLALLFVCNRSEIFFSSYYSAARKMGDRLIKCITINTSVKWDINTVSCIFSTLFTLIVFLLCKIQFFNGLIFFPFEQLHS